MPIPAPEAVDGASAPPPDETPKARKARRQREARQAAAGRRIEVLELRKQGLTYRQIAAIYGVTHKQIQRDYAKAIEEHATPVADDMRLLETMRLDELQAGHWDLALTGDHQAATVVLQIMARRAKMWGLDEPKKIDITGMIRAIAEEAGLDPDEAVQDAMDIVAEARF